MANTFRENARSKAYIVLNIIVLCCVAGITYSIIKLDHEQHIASLRQDARQALHEVTNQVQHQFQETVLVTKNIENILLSSESFKDKKIELLINDLLEQNPGIIAYALAPGLKITRSFPETPDSKVVGLEYKNIPAQLSGVANAYRRQTPVIEGPLPLVQGGKGYIMHYPVFERPQGLGAPRFWGVISIVFDCDTLFNLQQNNPHLSGEYTFGLSALPANSPAALPSEAEAANSHVVSSRFELHGKTWEATARLTHGLPPYSPQSPYLVAFALFATIALLAGLWAFRRVTLKKQEAHTLLTEAINTIQEGFIAFDEKERLVSVNQKFLEYHPKIADGMVPGRTMEELLRLWVEKNQFPVEISEREEWIAKRMARFRNPTGSFLLEVTKDFWVKVNEAKTPHGYTVGIWTNITAEKRAIDAAEAADREKTEFLNNVSHELRTPLTVISGRATFLQHAERLPQARRLQTALDNSTGTSPEIRGGVEDYQTFVSEQAGGIAGSSKHMLRLVEDLLDWTKVARGKMELDLQEIEASDIARSVAEDLRPDAEAKGLTLTYDDNGTAIVNADPVRLRQILYNLISNAIKFTKTGNIHLSMVQDAEEITFSVTDTGCGISPENLDRVFLRFQQVDGSMSRENGGLGLGLAIAEQLASLHGGALALESEVEIGSTFRLTLPRPAVDCEVRQSA
ncbi:Signal transduction histidine kinase [Sulfitobacter delicatus]|uniref:histidine kinase n=1 Tax=Sulfitobacter delicatus TaxID=218672 RepID=A0A1G7RYF4_9RHOB|nr:Signal transduction histidine kinase [Sulfitobacter delicatus]